MTNDELTAAINEFPGGDDFLKGYLLGLGFTSMDEDGESYFGAGSGQFEDYVTVEEIVDVLGHDGMRQVLDDCLAFLNAAHHLLDGGDMERAGTDFHFTRNGHGAGFWDGDWPEHGDELTKLSKPFGELEIREGYLE